MVRSPDRGVRGRATWDSPTGLVTGGGKSTASVASRFVQLPSGIVTFLFTDVEGSTRRWQDDPEAMRALLAEHDDALRRAIVEHRGQVFKHTGDGIAAAFASASDAVEAAVDGQRLLRDLLPVRMGVHTGEAELRDGDYYGSTLNRCARLMGVAHAGQVLVSNATSALLAGQPVDGIEVVQLGTVRLRGLTEPEVAHQVVADDLPHAFPPLEGQAVDTLPRPRTSLVGRERAVDDLVGLLGIERMVTLVGVGGTGKTRLAIEVGRRAFASFPDGAIFAALADVDSTDGVARAIALAAELRGGSVPGAEGPSDHRELVLRALAPREALLVVDNCEHLLDPVAALVDEILERSPGITVIATSREPLGMSGERVWRVPSLDDEAAVELLIERARASKADLTFSTEDREVAAELSRRLDGLPLAIELAAARFRVMSVREVAARLDDRFRLLAGRGRAHDRHTTLRATLDWSHDLLDPDEQVLLARVSVFAGGFDLDAAERVCGTDPLAAGQVMDALVALVDKSLVVAGERDGHSRYWLLETVRAYAAERLIDRGETDAVIARHAAWIVRLAQMFWLAVAEGAQTLDEQTFVREADNARAAHTWTVEQAYALDAQWIASAFAMTWHDRGGAAEATQRCEDALAITAGESDPLVACLCHGAAVRGLHWRYVPSWSHCFAALELSEGLDELLGLWVWVTLATVAATFDAPNGLTFDECIARARELDHGRQRGYLLMIEGQYRLRTGRPEAARPAFEEALRALDHPSLQGWCLLMLAINRYVLTGAIALTERDVDRICFGDTVKRPVVRGLQAIQAAINREPVHDILADALDVTRRLGVPDGTLFASAAASALEAGDAATAARLLGASSSAADWASPSLAQRLHPLLRDQLDADELDRLLTEGRQLDDADAIALVLAIP